MTKKKTIPAGPLCYCGPRIGTVQSFAVFRDTPAELKEAASKCPGVQNLIVEVGKIAETRKAIRTPGTVEAASVKAIETMRKGGIL